MEGDGNGGRLGGPTVTADGRGPVPDMTAGHHADLVARGHHKPGKS